MSRGRASGKQIARAVDLVVRTLGHSVVLSLGTTWRVRHVGRENAVRARSMGGPVIYAFTHGVLLPLVYTHRRRGIHILASQSRDGDRIAAVAGHLGYESVRGSSSRGGREALARLVECAKAGHDLGITPDGPRGPRGSVSPGVVVMASRAGVPILPLGVAATRAFHASSWDRFLLPLPAARVFVAYGRPLCVESDAAPADIERHCESLKSALVAVETKACSYASGAVMPPGTDRVAG